MSWQNLGSWWVGEVASDPAYQEVITPLFLEVLDPQPGHLYLDMGCGEGRLMRELDQLGAEAFGVDVNEELVGLSGTRSVVAEMTGLPLRDATFHGAFLVLALEHVPNHVAAFSEAARVTKPGGALALVINHPIWTAPESTPITDSDGEVLWRPGGYFSQGSSRLAAGDHEVVFHHRTMGSLLSAAAGSGWCLEEMIEMPHHENQSQPHIPRLMACRWVLKS